MATWPVPSELTQASELLSGLSPQSSLGVGTGLFFFLHCFPENKPGPGTEKVPEKDLVGPI